MANANRVKETTTATNLATITLGGAVASFRSFATGLAAGVKRTGIKVQVGPDTNGAWLIGAYDLTADNTLTRRAILDSSAGGADVTLAAGSKEVSNTITAVQGDRIDAGTSVSMVFTSSICVSDADVSLGSTNLGTDQGAKVQRLLDLATAGPLLLVNDCQIGVLPQFAETALAMRNNTTISSLPGCGFILQGNTEVNLISNYDRDDGRGTGSSYPNNKGGNKNISILGGIWNGNNVAGRVIQMMGVDGLVIDNPNIYNSGHFHFHGGNLKRVTLRRFAIDKGTGAGIFSDGIHICGPADDVVVDDPTVLNCADDNVALNADDAWAGNTETYRPRGPITNVRVRGTRMASKLYGVRVLSGASLVDDVVIEDTSGSAVGYWLVIDPFIPAQTENSGLGNIGRLTIRNSNVEVTAGGDANLKTCAHINCKIDSLTLDKIYRRKFLDSEYASLRFGAMADIRQLTISQYESYPTKGGSYLVDQIVFMSGSKAGTVNIDLCKFDAPTALSGTPIRVKSGATIGQLNLKGNSGTNFADFVTIEAGASVSKVNLGSDNVMDTAAAASTWSLEAGFTEQSASAVTYAGPRNDYRSAIKTSSDPYAANDQLKVRVRLTATQTGTYQVAAGLVLRAVQPQPWGNGSTATAYFMEASNTTGFRIALKSGSTETVIAPAKGVAVIGTDYDITFTAKNNLLTGVVQRVSDGLYLQTDGTWGAAAATALSGTNNALGSGGGLPYGVYAYANNSDNVTACGVNFTNFAIAAAP